MLHPVIPALVTEYVMVGLSSAVAKDEGVKGDCCTRIAVVGDQATVCVALENVNGVAELVALS
jgi:hypothetical protein